MGSVFISSQERGPSTLLMKNSASFSEDRVVSIVEAIEEERDRQVRPGPKSVKHGAPFANTGRIRPQSRIPRGDILDREC